MGDTLGVCVMGCGRAGMIHARNLAGSVPGARLVALCDPDERALSAAGRELHITHLHRRPEDALADPAVEAVVVVTPTDLHHDITVDAAHRGIHILCEKPMASSPAQCDEMIEACAEAGVVLQIGFMRRFDPGFRRLHDLLVAGEVGSPTLVRSITHGPSEPQPWMFDTSRSGGPLAEVNSHDFDTFRWMAGAEAVRVHAVGHNFRSPEMAETHPDFYDTCAVLVEAANGVIGMVEGAQYVRYGYDARVEVLGTTGQLSVGTQRADSVSCARADGTVVSRAMASWRDLFRDAYLEEVRAFVDSCLTGAPPQVTGWDGRQALVLVESALASLRCGEPVEVPQG